MWLLGKWWRSLKYKVLCSLSRQYHQVSNVGRPRSEPPGLLFNRWALFPSSWRTREEANGKARSQVTTEKEMGQSFACLLLTPFPASCLSEFQGPESEHFYFPDSLTYWPSVTLSPRGLFEVKSLQLKKKGGEIKITMLTHLHLPIHLGRKESFKNLWVLQAS